MYPTTCRDEALRSVSLTGMNHPQGAPLRTRSIHCLLWLSLSMAVTALLRAQAPSEKLGTHGFADSQGVKIHYVTAGPTDPASRASEKGAPLVVLLHGFPDYWYTWREQIPELSKRHKVVAVDLRGYNESDKPEGVESYGFEKLLGDVESVLAHFKAEKAVIAGHDWGGAIAWNFAMRRPEKTERLIILNLPHPRGLMRELASNPEQQKASEYAWGFQKPDAASRLNAEMLAFWVKDPEAKKKYVEAFKRSSLEGMLNYYKANFPRKPGADAPLVAPDLPPVKCPVLMIHGLKDSALLPAALNDTWKWVEGELTLVTIPGAGHFVQQDAAERVTRKMAEWLESTK